MSIMIERLEGMVNRYHEITEMMMMPEIVSDSKELAKLGKEQADLTQVVETYEEYKKSAEALQEAKELLMEDDKELKKWRRWKLKNLSLKLKNF